MNDDKDPLRQRILKSANRLIDEQGFQATSFAHIADELGISKGNLHYHFRSKDALLTAVIEQRKEAIRALLQQWDTEISEPQQKLARFVQMLLIEQHDIARYGCPMGSLNLELGKQHPALQEQARAMFDLFKTWLKDVFTELQIDNAEAQSLRLLAQAQGIATLARVYADTEWLKKECARLQTEIETLWGERA